MVEWESTDENDRCNFSYSVSIKSTEGEKIDEKIQIDGTETELNVTSLGPCAEYELEIETFNNNISFRNDTMTGKTNPEGNSIF